MRLNRFHPPRVHDTLCRPLSRSLSAPLLCCPRRSSSERETRVEDIESWQESKETIREEETRLSCQKEMKTELSVTEHRLHGSNSFRFTVQPLSNVQRFPSTFLILTPCPPPHLLPPKSFDLARCSPAPRAVYEVRAKEILLYKKEEVTPWKKAYL